MKFVCRIIEKTKLFPLTVLSRYYIKTFLLYSMWSIFTVQFLHLWCLLDKYIHVQMYKPCTIIICVQSNRKNRNNQKALPIFLPGFQNILLYACNKTFYHASLLGINTPSFFLAILIFFLHNNTSCYFQFQDCPRLLCSQQEPGSLCAISFLLFFMPKGHPV